MRDHNSKSGNDRETSTYFEELNEILSCRAKITPKTVVECGFIDDSSVIPGPSLEELSKSDDDESIRYREEQTLSEALFRREPAAKNWTKYAWLVRRTGRRGCFMVSALIPGLRGPGSSPGRGHRVVFLGKTLYSHSASLHTGV